MGAKINLLNQKFGKLLVIEETSERKNKSVIWKCQCDCGQICYYSTKELRNDGIIQCHNCGTNRIPAKVLPSLIGRKFNHLTVLEKTNKTASGKILYKCECDCREKTITYVSRTDLISNHILSCGCIRRKYNIGDIINNREIIDYTLNQQSKNFYYSCKCLLCGRIYKITSGNLQKTISCGCQKSIGEFNIVQILKINNIKFQKEYVFPNSKYRFDFAIFNEQDNIVRLIEFDGEQHYENNIKNSGWNTYEKYEYTLNNDIQKNLLAKEKNIPLIRIPYWERDNITLDLIMGNKYMIE